MAERKDLIDFFHFLVEVFLVKTEDQCALPVLVRVLFAIYPAT
jgi:hypothetical protein